MEPGGIDDLAWYKTWDRLGGTELIDCRQHHLETGFLRWHTRHHPPTQTTWRLLIALLLGFEQRHVDLDTISTYQRDEWGSSSGESALLEVSAVRARNLATFVDRKSFRGERIARLRERVKEHRPRFVVFYGSSYKMLYEQIVGTGFDVGGYARARGTLCVLVNHPAAINNPLEMKSPAWWAAKGQEVRSRIGGSDDCCSGAMLSSPRPAMQPLRPPARRVHGLSMDPLSTTVRNVTENDIIQLLIEQNPKLDGSKSRLRYECYRDGMTISQYRDEVYIRLGDSEARKWRADLMWDSTRGFIQIRNSGG